jgi:hypothetical protein
MAMKNLPDDETDLKHLLAVAKDFLDFMGRKREQAH